MPKTEHSLEGCPAEPTGPESTSSVPASGPEASSPILSDEGSGPTTIRPEEPDSEVASDESDDGDYEIDGDALFADFAMSSVIDDSLEEPAKQEEPETPSALLQRRLGALAQENEGLHRQLLQLKAEFENVRRRSGREREEAHLHMRGEIFKQILPLVDNFERALSHATAGASGEDLVAGVALIYKQMCGILERNGLQPIKAAGESFDPHLHEAVVVETRPDCEGHTVIEEIEKGYTLDARVLRPARVKVAVRP